MAKIYPKGICIEQREPMLVFEVTESVGSKLAGELRLSPPFHYPLDIPSC